MSTPTVRLLLTRPRADSERFWGLLSKQTQAKVGLIISPLIEIAAIVDTLDLGDAAGLIFTSSNGVDVAARLTSRRDLPCFCVGATTTRCATEAGWSARCMGEHADGLVDALTKAPPAGPLLHLRGVHARGEIDRRLTTAGVTTTSLAIYDQRLGDLTAEAADLKDHHAPVVVPLFSPRTARHFADLWGSRRNTFVVAMSPAVEGEIKSHNFNVLLTCERPTADAMAETVEDLIEQAIRLEAARGQG